MVPPLGCPSALRHGFRLGAVVEVHGLAKLDGGPPDGSLGQLVSYNERAETFSVCLLNGSITEVGADGVRAPSGLKRPGLGGGPQSFDVLVGPRLQEDVLAEEIAACLFEKGFCVLRKCQSSEETQRAFSAVRSLGRSRRLQRFPEEVEEGYLGIGNKGKITWLSSKSGSLQDPMLQVSDAFFTTLGDLLRPHLVDTTGKVLDVRSQALLSLSLSEDEEPDFPPSEADDEILGKFLSFWRRSHVTMVHFMGPGTALVTLESNGDEAAEKLPYKQETIDIEALPNTILIFRTGLFAYNCRCEQETLSLSVNLMEQSSQLVFAGHGGDLSFLRFGDGPSGPPGESVNVVNLSSRLMASFDEPEAYRAGLYGGCDCGVEIPFTRWSVYDYYNPDPNTLQGWQTATCHQTLVEGIELFDNKYFEISNTEARVMDPMQRHVLEVGAQNLFKLGITKKFSNRNPHHAGCSVGLDKDDWDQVPDKEVGNTPNVQAIISNRFSFIFNLRGPNFVADTACSASLCATHLAKFTLQDRTVDKIEFHIALGIHQCLAPGPFIGYSQSRMAPPVGRCLTFNATASGYQRGDGCSGMTLKWGDLPDERDAIWRASQCGQNGRSATLTAPNGLAQEEVIWKAYREAKISPPESCVWNCHGTGTALGDPIEVGAIRKVQNKHSRPTTLLVVTNKTHTGHLEGGAAMTSLIAAVLQVKSSTAIPICHFRQLNPHLEQTSFDGIFNSEMNSYSFSQGHCHVSSFGFGGTNGHVIFWGENVYDVPDVQALFDRRLRKMAPPEVRVMGSDPSQWEWDGPDQDAKPGDRYLLQLNPEDPIDAPQRWVKEEDFQALDDGEDDFYSITGPFNEWEAERMEDGPVVGLRTVTVPVPDSGLVEFRFLKNGLEDEVIYPLFDKCNRKTTPILGPCSEDEGREKNTWSVEGQPGGRLRIDLFIWRGRRGILWMAA